MLNIPVKKYNAVCECVIIEKKLPFHRSLCFVPLITKSDFAPTSVMHQGKRHDAPINNSLKSATLFGAQFM